MGNKRVQNLPVFKRGSPGSNSCSSIPLSDSHLQVLKIKAGSTMDRQCNTGEGVGTRLGDHSDIMVQTNTHKEASLPGKLEEKVLTATLASRHCGG